MLNRCTYIYNGKRIPTYERGNRQIETSKDSVSLNLQCHGFALFIHYPLQNDAHTASKEYNYNRNSPYGISRSFPTPIWGFSLLHTPFSTGSFGVLYNYLHQATR
jgi:hypothetical protein